jgi:hypothetical protein
MGDGKKGTTMSNENTTGSGLLRGIRNTAGAAGAGALIGSLFGPPGTAIGLTWGFVLGAIASLSEATEAPEGGHDSSNDCQ